MPKISWAMVIFQSLKNGRAYTGRHIDRDTLNDAAQRFAAVAGVANVLFHLFTLCIVRTGKSFSRTSRISFLVTLVRLNASS